MRREQKVAHLREIRIVRELQQQIAEKRVFVRRQELDRRQDILRNQSEVYEKTETAWRHAVMANPCDPACRMWGMSLTHQLELMTETETEVAVAGKAHEQATQGWSMALANGRAVRDLHNAARRSLDRKRQGIAMADAADLFLARKNVL